MLSDGDELLQRPDAVSAWGAVARGAVTKEVLVAATAVVAMVEVEMERAVAVRSGRVV